MLRYKTSGIQTERVNSYNPGARTGQVANFIERDASGLSTFATLYLPGSTVFRQVLSFSTPVI